VKDQIYRVVSVLAIISYFIPLFIVVVRKFWSERAFLLFSAYWVTGGLINILDYIGLEKRTIQVINVIYNMLDVPFIMTIFYLTTTSRQLKKFILLTGVPYVIAEAYLAATGGIYYDTFKYSLGVGIVMVITMILWEIILYLKKMHHSPTQRTLIFIYAALLFEYGTFIVIYIFDYFVIVTDNRDNFLIYYVSSIIAAAIASYGLIVKKTRQKKPTWKKREQIVTII
jgi:hypothetical protein